jgi:uncharacterized membrane protein
MPPLDNYPNVYQYATDKSLTPSHTRTSDEARDEARVLLTRLGLSKADIDKILPSGSDAEVLLRYATDVPLNILWYQRALKQQHGYRTGWVLLSLLVGVATTLLPLLLLLFHAPQAKEASVLLAAQLGMITTAVGSGWKIVSNLDHTKQRIGIFWSAGADLKEELLTFEDKWRRQFASGTLTPEFTNALAASNTRARAIARKERTDFFATYASPAEIVTAATSVADGLTKARDALLEAQRATDQAVFAEATRTLAIKEGAWKDLDARVNEKNDPALLKAHTDYMTAFSAKLEAEHRVQRLVTPPR